MCEASANIMWQLKKKKKEKKIKHKIKGRNWNDGNISALCKQNIKENTDDTLETAWAQSEAGMQTSLCCREIREAR